MKSYVIDACVILKWIFKTDDDKEHIDKALNLLKLIERGECQIQQPIHWLPEVISVICRRLDTNRTAEILGSLLAMNFAINEEIEVYTSAAHLSSKYNHHLFDTLYHAVALESVNTVFITSDAKYYKRTKSEGSIMLLSDFS
ncbi:MAG: type II toxin-antitoxin system VapC family toxin [Gammaproteobacteria bacterium]|nr:type II toxin-antitoxin system VapC family toxin [Gammaproteobacteria bacterium]